MPATQVKYPHRATIRTLVAAAVGILPILPIAARELGIDSIPWVATILAVSAAITRVLAHPTTEKWLGHYAPWLTASPPPTPKHQKDNPRDS